MQEASTWQETRDMNLLLDELPDEEEVLLSEESPEPEKKPRRRRRTRSAKPKAQPK